MSVPIALVAVAAILTLVNAVSGKCPLWVPVIMICFALLYPALFPSK